MRWMPLLALLVPAVALARPASPRVYGTSETSPPFWPARDPSGASDDTAMRFPIYEIVTVRGRDLGVEGLSVDVSGFGQLEATPAFIEDRGAGDLLFGYVRWVDPGGHARVTAGRQFVYRGGGYGAAIDGVSAEGWLPLNLQVQAFGGVITERQFEGTLERPAVGGRVAWAPWDLGHVAASYFQQWNDGQIDRQSVGADASFRYFKELELTSSVLFDMVGLGVQDLDVSATVLANRWVTAFVHYGLFDPDAFLPRTSIFWVFARETHHEVGGGVSVRPLRGLSVGLNWDHYLYGDGDTGYLGKLRVTYALPLTFPVSAGAEYSRMSERDNGYDAVRVFGSGETGFGLRFSAEAMAWLFAHDVKGYPRSLTSFGGLGYRILPELVLDAGLEVNHTPLVTAELVGFTKLTWTFAAGAR